MLLFPQDCLATGFIADDPDEASSYPSAGSNSGAFSFQATYWRCIAVFLYSATVNAASCRRILFSNINVPLVDGVDLAAAFRSLGSEHIRLPLTHRLTRAKNWGNVFYVLDIIGRVPDRGTFALFDSDVVFTGPVDPLLRRIEAEKFVGYKVNTKRGEDVNGLTMEAAAQLVLRIRGTVDTEAVVHWGGELFGADLATLASLRPEIDMFWKAVVADENGLGAICTEEHFWSIFFPLNGLQCVSANDILKRMWTARKFRDVVPGDEALPIWHLPAEKRYGFVDLFDWIVKRDFNPDVDPREFREVAQRCFGVPNLGGRKHIHDLSTRIRARLGVNRRRPIRA